MIMRSIMNTPALQQAALNAQNVGQDKRAVGSRNAMMNKLVRSEGSRLHAMDVEGDRLATRKDKLGFAKQIATQKHAMALDRMKQKRKSDSLANVLGGFSTLATGIGGYQNWRARGIATQRHEDMMNIYQPYRHQAAVFNKEYGGNR